MDGVDLYHLNDESDRIHTPATLVKLKKMKAWPQRFDPSILKGLARSAGHSFWHRDPTCDNHIILNIAPTAVDRGRDDKDLPISNLDAFVLYRLLSKPRWVQKC